MGGPRILPRMLGIFRQSWIYFLGASLLAAVLLIWYHFDPSTAPITFR